MIKSNNLMNQALAAQQAFQRGAFDGVMRNDRGELTECATSNLFIVRNDTVLTPAVECGLLPGITRELLFEVQAARAERRGLSHRARSSPGAMSGSGRRSGDQGEGGDGGEEGDRGERQRDPVEAPGGRPVAGARPSSSED